MEITHRWGGIQKDFMNQLIIRQVIGREVHCRASICRGVVMDWARIGEAGEHSRADGCENPHSPVQKNR